jgi:SAM-dependent methyltransferase
MFVWDVAHVRTALDSARTAGGAGLAIVEATFTEHTAVWLPLGEPAGEWGPARTYSGGRLPPPIVAAPQQRTAGAADLRVHDLFEPLTWVRDNSIDLVVCALTLHYIDDRVALLREFGRVLAPGGAVVLSITTRRAIG